MVETFLRQSPLASLGLAGRALAARGDAGVALSERPFPGLVNLRGKHKSASAAVELTFGFALPAAPNTTAAKGKTSAFWLGPDEWWLLAEDGTKLAAKLRDAVDGKGCAVTEVGESRTVIRATGPRARDLLAKGCPLDLHPSLFAKGACAQTVMAKAGVLIHAVDDGPTYDLYVLRSFAEYLWRWLEDAGQEYGVAVLAS